MNLRTYSIQELRELVVVLLRLKFFPPMGDENFSKTLNRLLADIKSFVENEFEDSTQKQLLLGPFDCEFNMNGIQLVLDGLKARFPYNTESFEQLFEDFEDGVFPKIVTEEQWVVVKSQLREMAKKNDL